jgi:hypothetical protein
MRNESESSEQKNGLLKGKEKHLDRRKSMKEGWSGKAISMRERSEG